MDLGDRAGPASPAQFSVTSERALQRTSKASDARDRQCRRGTRCERKPARGRAISGRCGGPGGSSRLQHCTEKATPYRGSAAAGMAIEAGDRLFRIGPPIASAIKSRGPADISTIT